MRLAAPAGAGTYQLAWGCPLAARALAFCETFYGNRLSVAQNGSDCRSRFCFRCHGKTGGAITFRENLLLHFPETTSAEAVERICEVIAHEIAHQWFGKSRDPGGIGNTCGSTKASPPISVTVLWRTPIRTGAHGTSFLHTPDEPTAMARDGLKATFPHRDSRRPACGDQFEYSPHYLQQGGQHAAHDSRAHRPPSVTGRGLRTYLERHGLCLCPKAAICWEAFEDAAALPVYRHGAELDRPARVTRC